MIHAGTLKPLIESPLSHVLAPYSWLLVIRTMATETNLLKG